MSVNYDDLSNTVHLAIGGNADAIQQLYTDTFPSLYSIALELMGNPHEAEDMVQEAFHLIFLNLAKIPNTRYFIPWSKTIVRNYCYRTLRSPVDTPVDSIEVLADENMIDEGDPVNSLIEIERQNRITELLESMDPILRRTVILKFFEDKKVQEIAEIMDCPVGTVKSRLHKARKVMREMIEKDKPFFAMLAPALPLSVVLNKSTAQASKSVISTTLVGSTVAIAVSGVVVYSQVNTLPYDSTGYTDGVDNTSTYSGPMDSNIEFLNHTLDGDIASILVGEITPSSTHNATSEETSSNSSDVSNTNTSYHVGNVDFDSIYAITEDGDTVLPSSVDADTGVVVFESITESITVSVSDYSGRTIKSKITKNL